MIGKTVVALFTAKAHTCIDDTDSPVAVTSSAGSYDVTYVTESTDAFTWEEPIEKIRRQHNQQGIFIWYRMLVHMFYMYFRVWL